jgi:transposase-like protein
MAKHSVYSDEFRAEALRRLAEDGIPITTLARELAVDVTTLRKWRKQASHQLPSTARSSTPLTLEETQRALEQSNEIIKRQQMEIDILKKAMGILSRMPQ